MMENVKLVECPRDAMQGWKTMIPTAKKVEYLNALLKVGFDTLDFGSFVSPKAIPQMADTKDVLPQLQLDGKTKLLAIIANERGAQDAVQYDEISYLGYPYSISETFQLKNTNATIEESLGRVGEIQNLCLQRNKQLVVYISMGFGNPYGDPYNAEIVEKWCNRLAMMDIKTLALSDTVGLATAEEIAQVTAPLIKQLPHVEIGVHLHAAPQNVVDKTAAAFAAGCRRFDGAINGIGGCPMAKDDLVGNMDTVLMVHWLQNQGHLPHLDMEAFRVAISIANEIFG